MKRLQGLSHPNVLKINDFDFDEESGMLYVYMEHPNKENLAHFL
jgi:hypothetical protein